MIYKISVRTEGVSRMMFDKFYDQSKTQREPIEKLYTAGKYVVFPSDNIWAFLTNQRDGCIRIFEGKGWQDMYRACSSYVSLAPETPQILGKHDEPITTDSDQIQIDNRNVVCGTGKNITREPRIRPVIDLPWAIEFEVSLFENPSLKLTKLEEWFRLGGRYVAFGNHRPRFGRFDVVRWDVEGEYDDQ